MCEEHSDLGEARISHSETLVTEQLRAHDAKPTGSVRVLIGKGRAQKLSCKLAGVVGGVEIDSH